MGDKKKEKGEVLVGEEATQKMEDIIEQNREEETKRVDEYLDNEREAQLNDFDEQKDQKKALTAQKISKLNRWDRFEKQFPFYQIDINGFFHLLQRAMRLTYAHEDNKPIREIKVVSLDAMQEAFANNKTWTEALTQDSKLVQLFDDTCKVETPDDLPEDKICYSIQKIRCFAILWCEDGSKEKIGEFWSMMQDSDQQEIAAGDKDYYINMLHMFHVSSTMIFELEEKYTGLKGPVPSEDEINEKKDEYDSIMDAFEDKVYGEKSILTKEEWMNHVLSSQKWIFKPKDIRKKLGYK